jgi:hypothetical protein
MVSAQPGLIPQMSGRLTNLSHQNGIAERKIKDITLGA